MGYRLLMIALLLGLVCGCSNSSSDGSVGGVIENSGKNKGSLKNELSYKNIKIGDSEKAIMKELGTPISALKLSDLSKNFTNGDDRRQLSYKGVSFQILNGVVYAIELNGDDVTTKSGFKIRDKRERALEIYKKYENAVAGTNQLLILEDGYFFTIDFNDDEFWLVDDRYRVKPPIDVFKEAEKNKGKPLRAPGIGACSDSHAFRYVYELLDPSIGLWDGKPFSCAKS